MTLRVASTVLAVVAGLPGEAADTSAPAQANAARVWVALAGDRIELDGRTADLRGVDCAAPDTEEGRAAKALLNTFLRAGHVRCTLSGGLADCTVNGHDINAQMRGRPGCTAKDPPTPVEQPDQMTEILERRICPADPDLPWRTPTGLGPLSEQMQLLLYSLHLALRSQAADGC